MGKPSRDKGKRGQREFKLLLQEQDWTIMESRAGAEEEDFLGISPDGKVYSIEVKNCVCIDQRKFRAQAKKQADARKNTKWLLACAIDGFKNTFLIITSDKCTIWRSKDASL